MAKNADASENLQEVSTVVADSKNGYREVLNVAKDPKMAALFAEMLDLKEHHASELEGLLRDRGNLPFNSGSFLIKINRAIFSIKSVFTSADESVLPNPIDGEAKIVTYYDAVIAEAEERTHEKAAIAKQRAELLRMIDAMRAMQTKSS